MDYPAVIGSRGQFRIGGSENGVKYPRVTSEE
jgi:hypothetical protein